MGVVSSIEFFWSNMANPASHNILSSEKTRFFLGKCYLRAPLAYSPGNIAFR
jgi:hypothetical protein